MDGSGNEKKAGEELQRERQRKRQIKRREAGD